MTPSMPWNYSGHNRQSFFFHAPKEQRIKTKLFWLNNSRQSNKSAENVSLIPLFTTPLISRTFEEKKIFKVEEEWVSAGWPGRDVYVFTVQVCGLVEHALCVCGNYSNLNAGSAGETGCLLINEPSRWPRVGGSCECTASWSGGQRDNDTWAIMCLCTSSEQCTHNYPLINGFEMQKCVHFFRCRNLQNRRHGKAAFASFFRSSWNTVISSGNVNCEAKPLVSLHRRQQKATEGLELQKITEP